MICARDLMATKLLTFRPEQDINDAIDQLVKYGVSGGPVIQRGRLVGILSEKDCLNLLAQGAAHQLPQAQHVGDYMKRDVETIGPDADLLSIAGLFLSRPYRRLPVIDDQGRVLGQVSRHDVLKGIQQLRSPKRRYPDYRTPVEAPRASFKASAIWGS